MCCSLPQNPWPTDGLNGVELAGWHFTEEDIEIALSGRVLLNASIDLANPCDLNCPYCFIEEKLSRRKARRPNELSLAETFCVIDDLAGAGAKTINIVGAGEPLLDPYFPDIVSRVHGHGITTVVFTNGSRLSRNPSLCKFLFDHDCSVVMKVNSLDESVQDGVCGVEGYTRLRNAAITALLEAGFASVHPTRMGVDTLAFGGNLADLPLIHRWCRDSNIYPITAEFIPTGRTADGTVDEVSALHLLSEDLARIASDALKPLREQERVWLLNSIQAIDEEIGVRGVRPAAYFGGGSCTQLLGLYVDIEGNIWPCVARMQLAGRGAKRSPLGSIRNGDKPSDVWRASNYMHFIRKSYDGSCPYKPQLAGQRGAADASVQLPRKSKLLTIV